MHRPTTLLHPPDAAIFAGNRGFLARQTNMALSRGACLHQSLGTVSRFSSRQSFDLKDRHGHVGGLGLNGGVDAEAGEGAADDAAWKEQVLSFELASVRLLEASLSSSWR